MSTELSEEEIQSLYAWIDDIPLNRPKRNITRDFSDGVAAAEVVRHFMPKMVELHNYSPANAISQKIYNWNTLNQKTFKRMGYTASEELISGVVNCKAGYVEYLLFELRKKIEEYLIRKGKVKPGELTQLGMMNGMPMNMMGYPGMAYPGYAGMGFHGYPDQSGYPQMLPMLNAGIGMGMGQQISPISTTYAGMQTAIQNQSTAAVAGGVSSNSSDFNQRLKDNSSIHHNKDQVIKELTETVNILQLKVSKMEQLLQLKSKRLEELQDPQAMPNSSSHVVAAGGQRKAR